MSDRLAPILDWIETHAPQWTRPPPIDADVLGALAARGAPAALLSLYEHGAHVPGAFPRCSTGEEHLLPPSEVRAAEGRDGWLFSAPGSGGAWMMAHDARVVKVRLVADTYDDNDEVVERGGYVDVGAVTTIDDLLDAHFRALQEGELVWNEALGCFLYPDEREDLAWLAQLDDQVRSTLPGWTESIRDRLDKGEKVVIEDFGSFSLSVRRGFRGYDGTWAPTRRIAVFRAALPLKNFLNGTTDHFAVTDPLLVAIARQLQEGDRVGLPGLGQLSVSTRQSFRGHDPRAGQTLLVPQRRIPVFRSWRTLRTTLDPDTR